MHRLVIIKCKTCSKEFLPKSEKNVFCSRRCFKREYYHRKRAEELIENQNPSFICTKCGQSTVLDFNPIEESDRWLEFKCPNCNTLATHTSKERDVIEF